MSANSAVQHVSAGLGASAGGWILGPLQDGHLRHFGTVGLISVGATVVSLWIAGRVRRAGENIVRAGTLEPTETAAQAVE